MHSNVNGKSQITTLQYMFMSSHLQKLQLKNEKELKRKGIVKKVKCAVLSNFYFHLAF